MFSTERFVSIVSAFILALSLAGCGQSSQTTQNDAQAPQAQSDTQTPQAQTDAQTPGNAQTPPADTQEKPGVFARLFHPTKPITVPDGTPITVSLDQSLSSARNTPGDTFEATVLAPVMVNGTTVIPDGARAGGRVVDAHKSGRLHKVARLELELSWVEVGGKQYQIQTGEKTKIGKNHKKRNLVLIGGGSGLGALIGGLAAGGKGALIGGAAGAGAGTVGAFVTGKHDVHLPAESHLTFRLVRPVSIPVKT